MRGSGPGPKGAQLWPPSLRFSHRRPILARTMPASLALVKSRPGHRHRWLRNRRRPRQSAAVRRHQGIGCTNPGGDPRRRRVPFSLVHSHHGLARTARPVAAKKNPRQSTHPGFGGVTRTRLLAGRQGCRGMGGAARSACGLLTTASPSENNYTLVCDDLSADLRWIAPLSRLVFSQPSPFGASLGCSPLTRGRQCRENLKRLSSFRSSASPGNRVSRTEGSPFLLELPYGRVRDASAFG
jgi:hypothetical protein